MTKSKAKYILKKAKQSKKNISLKRQQDYFKPLKKVWSNTAAEYATEFSLELENILKEYQTDCIKLISTSKNIFNKQEPIEKAKKYKTFEYLDKKYNHVVAQHIKDTLVKLKESFKSQLKKAYNKYITKGSIKDSAELVFEDMDMDFNFNEFDEYTSEYLKKKVYSGLSKFQIVQKK